MGFSSALQGKTAHDALLVRQDAELRLLEVMKRCLLQKVKCDKEYAIALTAAAQHGLKIDRADDLQGKLNILKCIKTKRATDQPISTIHQKFSLKYAFRVCVCVCIPFLSLNVNRYFCDDGQKTNECRKPSDESMANRYGRMGTNSQTI